MGIYGFLSAAYQETANKEGNASAKIELLETKRDNIKEQLNVYNEEKTSINNSVTELRKGLANNKIQDQSHLRERTHPRCNSWAAQTGLTCL